MNRLDENFLIRATDDQFVLEISGRTVSGVSVPSAALRLSYLKADGLCQLLRRRGYKSAVVCNALGCPVTIEELRGGLQTGLQAADTDDGLPQTMKDVHKIRSTEFKKRWLNDPKFRGRVEELEAAQQQGTR